jgi:hypothetical protein
MPVPQPVALEVEVVVPIVAVPQLAIPTQGKHLNSSFADGQSPSRPC